MDSEERLRVEGISALETGRLLLELFRDCDYHRGDFGKLLEQIRPNLTVDKAIDLIVSYKDAGGG